MLGPSSIAPQDYSGLAPVDSGQFSSLSATVSTHTSQIGTINTQNAVQDFSIAANELRDDGQDTQLAKIDTTNGLTTGNVLTWNGTLYTGQAPAAGSTTLAALTDAQIASPAGSQLLRWNGTKWQNSYGKLVELTGDTAINTVGLADNDVLTYSAALAKWTNLTVPRNSRQLSDVATTLPTNGQVLLYSAATARWTPGAAPSGTISGATDYLVNGAIAGGDCMVWDSGVTKWRNSTRLTIVEQTLGTLTPPQAAVTSSAGQTVCVTYGTNALPTEGATQQATASDLLYPFASVQRTSDYVATPVASTSTLGYQNPVDGSNLWKTGPSDFQYVGGVSGNSGARINGDLGSSLLLAATSTFALTLASGVTFKQYRVYGSNDAAAMSDSTLLVGTVTGYTLLTDWGTSLGTGGPTSSTRNTLTQGPFRYISVIFANDGSGWNSNNDVSFTVRAAAGGVTGQSLLGGDITMVRNTSGNPVITNVAGAAENFVVDCTRLGLWLLWRDLLTTVTAKGTLRCGGWTIKQGPDLREVQLLNDGYDPATNTTPVAVNRGIALRTSTQGGKDYLILRPLGVSTGMCMAFNLSATATTDPGIAYMPNVASSASSDVVFALRMNGDVLFAGTAFPAQAGLLGNLNPFA